MALKLTANEIIKQVAIDVGIEEPTGTLVSSTDRGVKQVIQYIADTARELRSKYLFPELKKTHTITGVGTITQYPLPADMFQMIPGTQWDQTQGWQMDGPLTDQDWNYVQYGFITSLTRKRYRIFGSNYTNGQIKIDPAPAAADVLSFDYIRSQWFLPKAWATGETGIVSGTTYRSAKGNIYLAQTTGTAGITEPEHTTGTVTDGSINWLYVANQLYGTTEKFVADTDFPLVDGDLLIKGAVWKYLKRHGYDYQEDKFEYERDAATRYGLLEGAEVLRMSEMGPSTVGPNIPEGNFGV